MKGNILYSELLVDFLAYKKQLVKKSTYSNFAVICKNHIAPYWHGVKLCEITKNQVQEYVFYLSNYGRLDKNTGLSPKTVRDILGVMKLSFKYAFKMGLMQDFSFKSIDLPKMAHSRRFCVLIDTEQKNLLNAIYRDLNPKTAGILIAFATGIRIGELCSLKMKDIDLISNKIVINKTIQRIYDISSHSSYIDIGSPKTYSSDRAIPIPSRLGYILSGLCKSDNAENFFDKFYHAAWAT